MQKEIQAEKRFNLTHRLIHWAIAFTILFILTTILLRLGWMNMDSMGAIIQTSLKKNGINISNEAAALIGKNIRSSMWSWHIYAGYVMIGLYVIRMILTGLQGIAYQNPLTKATPNKDRFKGWVYIIFYCLLAVTLITGFVMVNGPKDLKATMKLIHVQSLYYLLVFVILHILGVLTANSTDQKGIVSKMISGDSK